MKILFNSGSLTVLKGKVYANHPTKIDQLKQNIRNEIVNIDLATLNRVFRSFEERLDRCIENNGGHIE